jgi:chromosome segregation ATPase
MKTSRKLGSLLLITISACATSSGADNAEAAANVMREAKQALTDAPAKITAVSTSLDALSKDGVDMKAEFKTYGEHVDALVQHRDYLRSLNAKIEQSRGTFTQHWEMRMKDIKNEDLRKRAEERRAALVEKFGEMKKTADAAREEFDPWMQTVVDVRTYLENDLNPTGVASVKDQVRKVRNGAASVNKKLTSIVESLEELSTKIAATKPPEPEPGTGEKK